MKLLDNVLNYLVVLPFLVQLAIVFIFSALVGSFLNVVIYRLPIMLTRDWKAQAREILELPAEQLKPFTLASPRSQCRDCGRTIQILENIPVLSYLLIRGKCRGCGAKISIFYPIVELATAMLATFVFWRLGGNVQGFFALFFVFALVALVGIDLKNQLLPDTITLPLMWVGIILSFWHVYIPLDISVIGALVGYLSLWSVATLFKILFKKEGMGLGDAKLLAAIFTWVHIQYFPLVLLLASVTGIVVTVICRFVNGQPVNNNPLPFGPYLALAGLVALLYGQEITVWYTQFLFSE